MRGDYKVPYKIIVFLNLKSNYVINVNSVKSHIYWHLRTALKQIFFPNKILVRLYQIKNKIIYQCAGHDQSLGKESRCVFQQTGRIRGRPQAGRPLGCLGQSLGRLGCWGLAGPVQCSMQRSLPIQRAPFFVALTIFNCHPRQVFCSSWCQLQ